MQNWDDFAARVADAVTNPSYWGHFSVPFPSTPESVAVTLVIALILFLARVAFGPKGVPFAIRIRDDGLANEDASTQKRIVQIDLKTAREEFPSIFKKGHSGETQPSILWVWKSKWEIRKVACVVKLNRRIPADTIEIHRDLAKELGIVGDAQEVKINFSWPLWRLDKRTFWNPDSNVSLQYRIGAIFLVLGIAVPKLVDYWLGFYAK